MESDDSGDELLQDVVMQICKSNARTRKKNTTSAQTTKVSTSLQNQTELQNAQALLAALSGVSSKSENLAAQSGSCSEIISSTGNSQIISDGTTYPIIYVSAESLRQGIQVPGDAILEVIPNITSVLDTNTLLPCPSHVELNPTLAFSYVKSSNIDNNYQKNVLDMSEELVNKGMNIMSPQMVEAISEAVQLCKKQSILNIQQIVTDNSPDLEKNSALSESSANDLEPKSNQASIEPAHLMKIASSAGDNQTNSHTNLSTGNNIDDFSATSNPIVNNLCNSSNDRCGVILENGRHTPAINMHDYCLQNSSGTLEEPIFYSAAIANLQELTNQQGPSVKCPQCDMPIVRRNFRRHLKEKHNLLVDLPIQPKKEIKPFLQRAVTCPECYLLVSRKNMQRHMRNIHKASSYNDLEWKGKSAKCPECDAIVASMNLRKHLRYKHKIFHYIREDDIEKRKIKCPVCGIMVCPNSLKKHLKSKHNIDENPALLSQNGGQQYSCQKCIASFAKKISLRKHMRLSHNIRLMNVTCREENCTFRCGEVIELGAHLELEHGMPQMKIEHNFSSLDEFESWKVQLEKETHSRFVKHRSSWGSQRGATVTKYYCNRSGFYISKGVRKRRSRIQGSCKMSGYCTAYMYVIWDKKTGSVQVTASTSHYGHGKEYEHLSYKNGWITIRVSQEMNANEKIFDNVKDSLSKQSGEMRKLVTKEIQEISLAFGMRGSERHVNENLSLTTWIEEMKKEESRSVLYAKLWNEIDPNVALSQDDLIIVLQTPIQAEMMKRFGQYIISIDATAGTRGHNCFLTGISIIDECGDGFPVAWCISSKNDSQIHQIFFKVVGENVGPISCKLFMFDGDESYYSVWLEVFGSNPKKLLCPWHVDQIWRKKLGETVEDVNEEILVYKKLQILMEESDIEKFNVLLACITANLCQNSETYNFGHFFKQKFTENAEQWAFCYRVHINNHTNIYLECLHQVLKYIRLRCKLIRRLDHVVVILLKYVRDKAYKRLLNLYEGKTSRIQTIYANHVQSLKMPCSIVKREKKGTWKVIDSGSDYFVTRIGSSTCKCPLQCPDCPVCVHEFYCSCLMSLIQTSICKHIHLVRRYNKKRHAARAHSLNASIEVGSDSDINDYCTVDLEENIDCIPNLETAGQSGIHVEAERQKLLTGVRHLCSYIQNELIEIPVDDMKETLEKLRTVLRDLQIIKQEQRSLMQYEPHW